MTYFKFRRDYYGYLFIAPFVIAFLIFGLYPVYNTLYLSLTDTTLMSGQSNFVGLKNFKDLFANNVFMTAVRNTWLIWILNFIPQIGIAMLLTGSVGYVFVAGIDPLMSYFKTAAYARFSVYDLSVVHSRRGSALSCTSR